MTKNEIDICDSFKVENSNTRILSILQEFFDVFKNMNKTDLKNTQYTTNIKNIINVLKINNQSITLKQISTKYNEVYNEKISLTTVSRIHKMHLNVRHLKISLKSKIGL